MRGGSVWGGWAKVHLTFRKLCEETEISSLRPKLQVGLHEGKCDVNRSHFLFPPMMPPHPSACRIRLHLCETAPPPNCNNKWYLHLWSKWILVFQLECVNRTPELNEAMEMSRAVSGTLWPNIYTTPVYLWFVFFFFTEQTLHKCKQVTEWNYVKLLEMTQ